MSNVYEGPPDGRQSADPDHPTSRLRPTYRALTAEEKLLHDTIKVYAEQLEKLMGEVGLTRSRLGRPARPREAALALTKLEEAVMWAIKGLTA